MPRAQPDRERSDRELVEAVLEGDRAAYRVIVERYEDVLFRRAVAIVRDRELAADMVQEALIRGYERLSDCSDPERVGGWLYRIVRNRCYDDLRAARRRGEPLASAAPLAGDANPGRDLEQRELGHLIEAALDTLSPQAREAFVMKHVDGLSYDEMKQITGVKRSALKMRVKRAREELEERLRPHVEPPDGVTPEAPPTSSPWKQQTTPDWGRT